MTPENFKEQFVSTNDTKYEVQLKPIDISNKPPKIKQKTLKIGKKNT